jgi:hypothetical protein
MQLNRVFCAGLLVSLLFFDAFVSDVFAATREPETPEEVLRALVRANAEKDLVRMGTLIAQDTDMICYSIGGRKYVGWSDFARDMQLEFDSVHRLEIPITELSVWARGEMAWFAMELDYIRYVPQENIQKTIIPLRETGVLERRGGKWLLIAWHDEWKLRDYPNLTILPSVR